jgi:3-oxoacyl-[acyl-carrier protein] reductase
MMSKTVLITGSSRGIGAAAARKFAREGWQVAVNWVRSQEKALALCRELGNGSVAIQADVSDPAQAAALVEQTVTAFGHLDALVCSAGIALPLDVVQNCSPEDWRRVFAVNVDGVFYTVRSALPHMIQQGGGKIVTLSSMWGQVGGSCEVPYSAAKGAVIAFTKALAQEAAPSGINVNCVAPGVIQTDMMAFADAQTLAALAEETPLGRLGTPEDVAGAIYYLCQAESSFLTGQVIGVNGGYVIT